MHQIIERFSVLVASTGTRYTKPNFLFIKTAVDIYDIVQYHYRNKHLPEILITKFDKYNQFNSIKGKKKSLPFSAHEHPAG